MLSNCQDCQYFHSEACGVNPHYREKTEALIRKLTAPELAYFEKDLPICPDWAPIPNVERFSFELTLTRRQWQILAEAIALHPEASNQGLTCMLPGPSQFNQGVEANNEIAMIKVESTSIKAIGWRAEVCQVEFMSGLKYQYFKVPEWIYLNFLKAPSKGWFFNEVFRVEYKFEYKLVS